MVDWKKEIMARLAGLDLEPTREAGIVEEMAQHLEDRFAELRARGAAEEEAKGAVLEELSRDGFLVSELRQLERVPCPEPVVLGQSKGSFVEEFFADLNYGARMLRKNPGFTAVAVLTLALGIGATTAVFSVVNGVLVRPLPYLHAEELVHLGSSMARGSALSEPEFLFLRDHSGLAFKDVAAFSGPDPTVPFQSGADVGYVKAMTVSESMLRALEISPLLGRGFLPEEDRPGGPHVVILSYGFWKSRFTADAGIVGRQIGLNNQAYTVVGVLPESIQSIWPGDVWFPLQLVFDPFDVGHNCNVIARLSGTIDQGRAEVARELKLQRQQFPKTVFDGERIIVTPYQQWAVGDVKVPLLVLLGAVGLVLLIASLNVANMLVVRATSRHREVAIRLALGAGRSRIIRQLLTEILPLPVMGAALGLVFALWAEAFFKTRAPSDIPLLNQVHLDSRVLGFSLVLAALAAIVSGLIPALHVARPQLCQALKEGTRGQSGGVARSKTRSLFVVAEVGLSTVLLSGAVLLIVSLTKLVRLNPGFDPQNLWVMGVILPPERYHTTAQISDFTRQVSERLQTLPGVKAVASASTSPVADQFNLMVDVHGDTVGAAQYRAVSPEYFKAIGVPLLTGRFLQAEDAANSPGVAVINKAFAKRFWPDHSPIGDVLTIMKGIPQFGDPPRQIVGVVADTTVWLGVPVSDRPMVYVPESQVHGLNSRSHVWVIRANTPPSPRDVEIKVKEVDPTQPVWSFQPATALIQQSASYERFMTTLLSAFAVLALSLAAIGLYGVISYSVAQRTREIGIRMALGATRSGVMSSVIRQGFFLAGIGVAAGLGGAFALTRFLASLLYGVRPYDPLIYTSVALVIGLVATLASYLPARRATRVDPMVALRDE